MKLRTALSAALALAMATVVIPGAAPAITPSDSGWYFEDGSHNPANQSFAAGFCDNCNGGAGELRNFFTFDLSPLSGTATSASLWMLIAMYDSLDASETYELSGISTDIATLTAGGTGLTSVFADLGDGPILGSRTILESEGGLFGSGLVEVPLNAAGLDAINNALGGTLAFGGKISSLTSGSVDELLFTFSRRGDAFLHIDFPCPSTASMSCTTGFGKASLAIDERKPGKEKVKAGLSKGPALAPADFGDPTEIGGSSYDLCVYDDEGALAGWIAVSRGGARCNGNPCWTQLRNGFKFADRAAAADGVSGIKLQAGDAGKSKVTIKAKNSSGAMPTGIAAALQGSTSATMQVHINNGTCLSATMNTVKKNDGTVFTAR